MDFFKIAMSEVKSGPRKGEFDIYPDFQVSRFTDLMVKGKQFYAIWDEKKGLWSTDEYDVQRLVDEELAAYVEKLDVSVPYSVKWLRSSSSGSWRAFRNFINLLSDNSHDLDSNLTFQNTEVKKDEYVSHRLPYSLTDGDCPGYDELLGTLYPVEERQKLEWAVGSIVAGDSKYIQKFVVLYGPPGSGKGTFLEILKRLFPGYCTYFNAKALGNSNDQFATEAFASNPLVAIQADGDMSRIADNTKINTIVSHEEMQMNSKYKPLHSSRVNAFLFMGTNSPVAITDAKSGLLRRLIDVSPSGADIPEDHYHALMAKVSFELGAIAAHCLKVYRQLGKNYYSGYRPTTMMLQTNVFFNFIEYNWDIFKEQDGTTLSQAYKLYKLYCDETGIEKPIPMYKMRDELRNYFKEFKDRGRFQNADVRSLYSGFIAHPFKAPTARGVHAYSLQLDSDTSLLDEFLADQPAQLASGDGVPLKKWANVTTKLSDISTRELHYVKTPENHVVIDFDRVDADGNKSLELNLQEAASAWPATYGEVSQGGNGVHLHYSYGGDVSELSSVHSRGIEVKTLVGDSSLRRRLSQCNAIPIATLAEGVLPKKEKRVLSEKTVKDEQHLRNLIRKAVRKDIGPGTKTNVDFIKKVTDEAYDTGMSYDITDLKPAIIAFANGSSNQSQIALQVVTTIHWKSELVDETAVMEEQPDKPHVIYDVEVYPNLFIICWKHRGASEDSIVDMVNPSPQEVEYLVSNYRLEGFYVITDGTTTTCCTRGCSDIPTSRCSNSHRRSSWVTGTTRSSERRTTCPTLIHGTTAVSRSRLKKFQIDLGLVHMESNIPWDEPVREEQIPQILKYCRNDVQTNDQVADDRAGDFKARQILAELSGLSVNHTTQSHTAKIIFGDDRNPQAQFQLPTTQ